MRNQISFRLWGKQALFTDPVTKIGGEKFSYQIPTYEAIKGVLKSIYWKPTLVWHIDKVRVIKSVRMQTKSTKPLDWNGGNSLAIYTFLQNVEYQVQAHFEWNEVRSELEADLVEAKHDAIAQRLLKRGGRQDIFLGTRDCQGYVEPCEFGEGPSDYDEAGELVFGLMFHSFAYPDETGVDELHTRFWVARMVNGVIEFPRVDDEGLKTRFVRAATIKPFGQDNIKSVEIEAGELNL